MSSSPSSRRRSRTPRTAVVRHTPSRVAIDSLDRRLMLSASSPSAAAALTNAAAAVPITQVPLLHSRPSAAVKFYLDFDGDVTADWGGFKPGTTPAYSADDDATTFTDAELADVREIFARVADFYAPFNVDVTTENPGPLANFKALRCVIGGDGAWTTDVDGDGGRAFLGAFANDGPNTVYIFSDLFAGGAGPHRIATAVAHEFGHALGPAHQSKYDGTTKVEEYNSGTPLTAPIMGGAYQSARALWWVGTSAYHSASVQDDLEIVAGNVNAFGYRADDRGNAPAAAATLALNTTVTGVVERVTDVDYYKFTTTAAGYVTIAGNVPPFARMLDPIVELRDAAGNVIATGDGAFFAAGAGGGAGGGAAGGGYQGDVITRHLAAGTYYVSVRGHGLVSTASQGLGTNLGSFYDIGTYTLTAGVSATPPQQAYPSPSNPFVVRASTVGGANVLQAENFDSGGQGVAYHDADAKNLPGQYRSADGVDIETTTDVGGGFAVGYAKPGEWLEYTVDVEKAAATFQIELRLAAAQSGATMHLELDGVNVTGSINVPNTGGWQKWQTVTKTDVFLAPGRHVLRVAFDKAGSTGFVANLNSLTFSPYEYVPPTQSPYAGKPFSVGQQIEAEHYDLGGEGVAYHDAEAANGGPFRSNEGVDTEVTTDAGGGYNVGFVRAGEYLEYTVDFGAGGLFDVQVRLASAAAGGKFHVELDTLNATGTLAVPNTGGFQKWQTVTKMIQAVAGVQTVRVAFDAAAANGFVGNLNWLKVTPAANPPKVTVQAEDYAAGGEGVGYHDLDAKNLPGQYRPADGVDIEMTTDAGGGFNVGYAKAGEWLKYDFDLEQGGLYRLDFRLASAFAGGRFHFEVDGVADATNVAVPVTGGYQSYRTVAATSLGLSNGRHTLRLVMDQNASSGYVGNFNWFSLTRIA